MATSPPDRNKRLGQVALSVLIGGKHMIASRLKVTIHLA